MLDAVVEDDEEDAVGVGSGSFVGETVLSPVPVVEGVGATVVVTGVEAVETGALRKRPEESR